MSKRPKDKPVCLFCKKPVNVEEIYFVITGPDGQEAMVHGHEGVEDMGVKMWKGKPVPKEKN
jgi:hypothetical protein